MGARERKYAFIGKNVILKFNVTDKHVMEYAKLVKNDKGAYESTKIELGEFMEHYRQIPQRLVFHYDDDDVILLDLHSDMAIKNNLVIEKIRWNEHYDLMIIQFIGSI
jgi:hypothetical protein